MLNSYRVSGTFLGCIRTGLFAPSSRKYCEERNGEEEEKKLHLLKCPTTASLRRGTGGRASFNGVVATVFGCSGFLGRYVCNKLGKVGAQLILPYRGDEFDMRRMRLVGDLGQVILQWFHLDEDDTIRRCVKHSNVVINLIGRDYETKNFSFDCVHVEGARILARIAKEEGVETFIHVSALNACEKPKSYFIKGGSNFLKSKHKGEEAVREEFPEAIIIRPSDMYGQEDRFCRYFTSLWRHNFKWMSLYKKGEETEKQPVYVGDVAAAIRILCTERKAHGKTFQAVGPSRYHLAELVDWFHRIVDRTEDWGYYRWHLEKDPIMQAKISLLPLLTLGWPKGNLHWEMVERECHSDTLQEDCPTIQDLGVQLTHMEDQVPWELRIFKTSNNFFQELKSFEEPKPPKTVSSH